MNLLVLCPHYAPDVAPTGEVMTAIVEGLADQGHRLHIVTSLPWYRHHAIEAEWRRGVWCSEDTPWGRITRVHPFPTDKTNIPARALAFGGFTALAGIRALCTRPRPDAVLAMSPPLTLGAAGWLSARVRGAPFVFNIQDVFPDVAIELGVLSGRRVIAAARALERWTYRRADAITVLSEDLADNVAGKLTSRSGGAPTRGDGARHPAKVRVIPNFVDTERIVPGPTENAYRREHGLTGRRVVMYAGNVGLSQSLDLLVDAARNRSADDGVTFVINGAGSALEGLRAEAADLDNVVFVGLQPRERLAEVLAAADVHVVPLRRGLAAASVPSKTYSILAAARPVLASVDPDTEVDRTVRAAAAGVSVPPDDPVAFRAALDRLLDDPDGASAMGAAGRAFVEQWASPSAVATRYGDLFDELRRAGCGPRGSLR